MRQTLEELAATKGSLAQVVDDISSADWVVRLQAGKVYLLPIADYENEQRDAAKAVSEEKSPRLFPLGEITEKVGATLSKHLQQVAWAEMLKRPASAPGTETARNLAGAGSRSDVEVQLVRIRGGQQEPLPPGISGVVVQPGDEFSALVRNTSRFPVDLTVLYVDSHHGIYAWYPCEGETGNELEPGKPARLLPAVQVTDKTFGAEHVVVIAVRSRPGQTVSFSWLEQPSLPTVRSQPSPLRSLLGNGLYGQGNTRGLIPSAVETVSLRLLPIRVEKKAGK